VVAHLLGILANGEKGWSAALCALLARGVGACLIGAIILSGAEAWGKEKHHQGTEAVVIAAVGYEDRAGSIITVKVYDAASGVVLSDDAYELIVKDDQDGPAAGWTARVFAGGTGIETADQSSIVLRAYDAETGAFQWIGRLHFDQLESDDGDAYPVAVSMPRRASLTKMENIKGSGTVQPLFVVRAWDVSIGTLLWEDMFIPEQQVYPMTRKAGRWEVGRRGGQPGGMVDFRVMMIDQERGEIVWQDRMVKTLRGRKSPRSSEERTPRLPGGLGRFPTSWLGDQSDRPSALFVLQREE
jgi:hypothetical protein